MHSPIFENSYDTASDIKDGGFVFQAILSYDMRWSIVDGESKYDQRWVEGKLHQVDVYPDMKFMEGYATLNYVILSEVNLFKRKLDLATEYIKMAFSKGYADEMNGIVAPQPEKKGPILGGIPNVVKPEEEDLSNIDFSDALRKADEEMQKRKSEKDSEVAKELSSGQESLPEPETGSDSENLPATTGENLPATTGENLPATTGENLPATTGENPPGEAEQGEEPATVDVTPREPTKIQLTEEQKKAINDKYFKGTSIKITFEAKRVVLREISTSSVDSGRPTCTLKLSTGMVDTLDGAPINSWNGFKIYASGAPFDGMIIDNTKTPPISKAVMYDPIESANDLIFRTILPSLYLEFSGDSVKIDTYSSRSAQVGFKAEIDFDDIFNEKEPAPIIEPEEGEETEDTEDAEENEADSESKNQVQQNLIAPPSEKVEGE